MKIAIRLLAAMGIIAAVLTITFVLGRTGGGQLPDRTTAAKYSWDDVETVVNLDFPPGNIAVSESGRVFFTLHPDGKPPSKVMTLGASGPEPWPDAAWQSAERTAESLLGFQSILSIRIDAKNRLWVLDYADYGQGQPRLLAFDIESAELVHRYDFPSSVAGIGSMLNDFVISTDTSRIYIAETSPLFQKPALIVYDTEEQQARRVLHMHESVMTESLVIRTPERVMKVAGILDLRIGVDSIALDRSGQWLYYGPVTGGALWRVSTADLNDANLSDDQLAGKVERFADKTLSDGLTSDDQGNIYLSDMEHAAIHIIQPDGKIQTLLKDTRLRWPDGFSFGPNGWLYFTCSALQHVLFTDAESLSANAPYQIYRFRPGTTAAAGQ